MPLLEYIYIRNKIEVTVKKVLTFTKILPFISNIFFQKKLTFSFKNMCKLYVQIITVHCVVCLPIVSYLKLKIAYLVVEEIYNWLCAGHVEYIYLHFKNRHPLDF